ncbi:MAG: hypothetical protein LC134_00525 [Chitinophagales bacterium]|nr:hypothetical protein [Chitinophagales bacterium]
MKTISTKEEEKINNKRIAFLCKHCVFPLAIGSLVYLLLRTEPTIAEKFIGWNFNALNIGSSKILSFIIGSLPDFCWLYALLFLQTAIWKGTGKIPLSLIIALYVIPILTELFQYLHIISGTGDIIDIIAYLLAITLHYYSQILNHHTHETHKMAS